MKKLTILITLLILTSFAFSQSVEIKDNAGQLLLQINDEGKVGSLSIPDGDPPIQTTGKLYNESGTLKWSGNSLSTGVHTVDTNAATECPPGEILTGDGSCITIPSGAADNLGNHIATQNVQLNSNWLSGDGGAEGIFIDADGDVGIGMSSPSRALQVYDDGITHVTFQSSVTGTGGDDGLEFTISGDNTAYIKNQENASLILGANNSNHLTINNSGNVGIGTINPSFKLDIYTSGTGILKLDGNNPQVDFYNSSSSHTYLQAHNDNFYITNRLATGTIYLGTNNITQMAIDEEGDVGIGTTSPDASLDVNGDIILGTSGTRFLEIQEISGVTGIGDNTIYTDKLPVGWTGAETRVLSFELQGSNDSGGWYSAGYHLITGSDEISYILIDFNRNLTVRYPDHTIFHGRTWRMMIMRMP